jgi:autotransporter-associated beta strand protein
MKTKIKRQGSTELPRLAGGALAIAGASAANAATVQITFNNSYISSFSGFHLDADFGNDGTADLVGQVRYGYTAGFNSVWLRGNVGLGWGGTVARVISSSGTGNINVYGNDASPLGYVLRDLVGITFSDLGIRAGAPTNGFLDLSASAVNITVHRLIFDAASATAPTGVSYLSGAFTEFLVPSNGTWTQLTTGGLWSAAGNWSGGIIADGSGRTANFSTLNLAAENTVKMDGSHTLTALTFQDSTTPFFKWTLDNNGSAANILTLAGTNPSITVGASTTAEISVVIAGSTDWSKAGTGTLILTGSNTYTGATTVSTGVINIQNATALGTAAGGTTVSSGAALELQGGITVGAEALTLNGTGVSSAGALRNISGNNTYGGLLTLGGAARINSDAGNLSISNVGTITGATFGLTVGGAGNTSIASIIGTTSGSLTKDGSGTLTLTGANTYSGGTTISAGTLSIGSGATTGSIAGNVANSGTLAFNRSDALTYAGVVSGTGALTQSGAGTLTLTGANTYSGGTTISAGTLSVGNGSTTGSIAGNVANSGTLAFNRSDALTYADVVSGTGAVTKSGAGTLTLTGANIYSGGTTISAGSLVGTTSSLQGAMTNNAAVTFDQSTAGTYAGAMSGSGSFTKLGAGTVTLTGANTYSGGTTISAGTLVGTTSSLRGAMTNNAAVTFDQLTDGTYAGVMSGSGSFTKLGTGTVTLSGSNTYSGGTWISGGTLTAGNVSAFGTGGLTIGSDTFLDLANYSIANTVTNNGGTILNAGTISGGDFSGGTTDLSGSNSTVAAVTGTATVNVSGTDTAITTVSGGTLNVNGAGTTIQSYNGGNVAVGAGLSVTIHDGTSSGSLSGAGGLAKAGTGTLTLTGTNTYTGATTLTAGLLTVNGSLGNTSTTVGNGGTLQGRGGVGGSVTVQSGGTIAAGNSIESLTTGALSLQAGSTFAYEINNDTAAGVAGDLTAVTGNLTLDLGNASLLTLSELGTGLWSIGEKLTLISYSGTWNGGLFSYGGTLADDSTINFSGMDWSFNYNDTSAGTNYTGDLTGSSFVTMTAIPEPNAAALVGGLGMLALLRRRRKACGTNSYTIGATANTQSITFTGGTGSISVTGAPTSLGLLALGAGGLLTRRRFKRKA